VKCYSPLMRPLLFSSLLLLISVAPASADVDDPPAPVLDCSARSLRIGAPNMEGRIVTCTVSGVSGEDSMVLGIQETDGVTFSDLCASPVQDGSSTCEAAIVRPTEEWRAGVRLSAELQPSGNAVGPVVFGMGPTEAPTILRPLPQP
jgi:hypothetical protein